ncbi:unnamed protein product [Amaranthus hypochondriacus]
MYLHDYAFLLYIFAFGARFCSPEDSIASNKLLKDPETILSNNGRFRLGFFGIPTTTNRYVGIWYNHPSEKEVVWVANRNNPLTDSSGVLKLAVDGNLKVYNARNETLWSSNVNNPGTNFSIAQLLNDGNLVIKGFLSNATHENGKTIWQSFQDPTDSIIPNMSFSSAPYANLRRVRAWKSPSDPSKGRFSLGISAKNSLGIFEIIIYDDNKPHWRTGPWNGNVFIGIRSNHTGYGNILVRGSFTQQEVGGMLSLIYAAANQTLLPHYVLTNQGILAQRWWDEKNKSWKIAFQAPSNECDIYGKCGEFGYCNPQTGPICRCLKGFEPKNEEEWRRGNWTSGCKRRKQLQCEEAGGGQNVFLRLQMMKVPENAELTMGLNKDECRSACSANCSCLAYAYDNQIKCLTWSRTLIDVADLSPVGVDLYLRLAKSELNDNKKIRTTILVSVILGFIAVVAIMWFLWRFLYKRSLTKCEVPPLIISEIADQKETEDTFVLGDKGKVTIHDLQFVKFEKLVKATYNFHESNLLGTGGFGEVYKGKLIDGQEIAVKRLARASRQGTEEFINEVQLISKLQHRNLVKLLGCCVERDERILIYEYLPNKSMDAFLFGLYI